MNSQKPDDTGPHIQSQVGRESLGSCHLKPVQFAIVTVILLESEVRRVHNGKNILSYTGKQKWEIPKETMCNVISQVVIT